MLKDEQLANADGTIRSVQTIAGALIVGVLMAMLVSLAVVGVKELTTNFDPLSLVGLALGVSTMAISFFVPQAISQANVVRVRKQNSKDPSSLVQELAGVFQTQKIIQYALLEGGAFAGIVIFFISKNVIVMAIAIVALAALILAFPTRQAAYDWIDARSDLKS